MPRSHPWDNWSSLLPFPASDPRDCSRLPLTVQSSWNKIVACCPFLLWQHRRFRLSRHREKHGLRYNRYVLRSDSHGRVQSKLLRPPYCQIPLRILLKAVLSSSFLLLIITHLQFVLSNPDSYLFLPSAPLSGSRMGKSFSHV